MRRGRSGCRDDRAGSSHHPRPSGRRQRRRRDRLDSPIVRRRSGRCWPRRGSRGPTTPARNQCPPCSKTCAFWIAFGGSTGLLANERRGSPGVLMSSASGCIWIPVQNEPYTRCQFPPVEEDLRVDGVVVVAGLRGEDRTVVDPALEVPRRRGGRHTDRRAVRPEARGGVVEVKRCHRTRRRAGPRGVRRHRRESTRAVQANPSTPTDRRGCRWTGERRCRPDRVGRAGRSKGRRTSHRRRTGLGRGRGRRPHRTGSRRCRPSSRACRVAERRSPRGRPRPNRRPTPRRRGSTIARAGSISPRL